jgi:hypothetical protein
MPRALRGRWSLLARSCLAVGQQSYILTNDPNFNPGQYDIAARQLAVVQ